MGARPSGGTCVDTRRGNHCQVQPPQPGTVDGDTVKGVIPPVADEAAGDTDNDRLCLDCLALTGLSVIFSILAIGFSSQTRRKVRPYRKPQPLLLNFYTTYSTRGPPAQA